MWPHRHMYTNSLVLLNFSLSLVSFPFAIFQNAYIVAKYNVDSTVGYAAATCFFILCPNSEILWPMYGNRNTILVLSFSVLILLTSIACSIHLLIMLIGNTFPVNIDR